MSKTLKIQIDFTEKNVLGEAAGLSDRQVNSLNMGNNSPRLDKKLTYYIPKQKLHLEKWSDAADAQPSIKVFAIGIDENGDAQCVTTLSINTLRGRYLGEAKDNLKLSTNVNDDGLVRFDPQPAQYSVWEDEFRIPVAAVDKTGLFKEDVFFKVTMRHQVAVPAFEKANKIVNGREAYNIKVYENTNIAALDVQPVWSYMQVEGTPVDTSCIPGFEKYAL